MQPSLGLMVVVSPLEVGADQAPAILKQAMEALSKAGMRPVAPTVVGGPAAARAAGASFAEVDALCVVAATWTEDYLVQDTLAAMGEPVPVIAWALPGLHTGSLCGTQQLCCVLKDLGYSYRFAYGELTDEKTRVRVMSVSQASAARRRLRRMRVARIGARMPGMAEVACDELALRAVLGPRLVERGLEWLAEEAEKADAKEAEAVWRRACAAAGKVKVPDSEGILAGRYYLALRDFLRAEEISAFTAECYPKLMGRICLPIALLSEEDVVGACEGDVNSAVAMRVLSWFSGSPVHNTDLLADDVTDNTIVFSHCGSGAFCLAACREDIVLDSCRLMNVGVTAQYPGRPERVTLVNLVGPAGDYRLGIVGGQAVETELVFPGNPVKVQLDVPVGEFLEEVCEIGLGHHWMIAPGDVIAQLQEFGRLAGIPVSHPGASAKANVSPRE